MGTTPQHLDNYFEFYSRHLKKIRKSDGSNYLAICAYHQDKDPSFCFDIETGQYYCFGCGRKGNAVTFARDLGIAIPPNLVKESQKPRKLTIPREAIEAWHEALFEDGDSTRMYRYLRGKRGLSREVLGRYRIGWDGNRIVFPIPDAEGNVINVRRYHPNQKPKMLSFGEGYGGNALFPLDQVKGGKVVIAEGEMDTLRLISEGIPAITNTTGAKSWKPEWNELFKGMTVTVCSDNDQAGLERNHHLAKELEGIAEEVRFINWQESKIANIDKGDVSDFFSHGGTLDDLRRLAKPIEALPPLPAKEKEGKHKLKANGQKIVEGGLREITPGLDFVNRTAYVAVPRIIIPENKPVHIVEIITSGRERFQLMDETLYQRGFYTLRNPRPRSRWSSESVEAFLNGDSICPLSLKALFTRIGEQYRLYIDFLDSRVYFLVSVWVIGTYFHRLFSAYPYIHLNGDPQTGKTKTLELTARLSFNGELTFHSTPAYIIRAISDNHCTCCVDEAERLRASKDEDRQLVISMFNSGYKRGATAGKVEATNRKGKWETRHFEAYSPKMFASIKDLDPVLTTRCIPLIMVESSDKEVKNRILNFENPTFQSIRDELYLAMMTNHEAIRDLYHGLKDNEIEGREWELWRPILSIALALDGEQGEDSELTLYQELRRLALEVGSAKKKQREEETSTPKLLLAFRELLGEEGEGFYSTSELAEALCGFDEEHFGWMTEEKTKGRAGKFLKREIHRLAIGQYENRRTYGVRKRGYHLSREAIENRLKGIGVDVLLWGDVPDVPDVPDRNSK